MLHKNCAAQSPPKQKHPPNPPTWAAKLVSENWEWSNDVKVITRGTVTGLGVGLAAVTEALRTAYLQGGGGGSSSKKFPENKKNEEGL